MIIKLSIFCCDFVLCRHASHVFVMFSLFLNTFLSKKVTNKWQKRGVNIEEKKTIAIKKIPHDKKWQKRWQIVYMMISSPGLQPYLLILPSPFWRHFACFQEMKSNTTFDWTCTIPGHKDIAWGQRTCKVDEQFNSCNYYDNAIWHHDVSWFIPVHG